MNIEHILKQEYIERGMAPKKILVDGKPILVPYDYVQSSRSFYDDFWDVNEQNALKYRKLGRVPKKIVYKGQNYVVPLKCSSKGYSNAKIAKKVASQAIKKYKAAIIQAIWLQKINNNKKIPFYIDRTTYACRKGMLFSRLNLDVNLNLPEVREFLSEKMRFVHSYKFEHGLRKVKRAAVSSLTAISLAGCGVLVSSKMFDDASAKITDETSVKKINQTEQLIQAVEKEKEEVIVPKVEKEKIEVNKKLPVNDGRINFADKCAGRYIDKYGNLAMLDKVYDDINVLLAMFENYSSTAYDDGWGNMTIGWGNTFYLDKYGRNMGRVKANDKITMEEAIMQKDLYLYYVAVPKLAKINHKMTKEEVAGFASVAWWMGSNVLEKSEFYRKLQQNDKTCWNSLLDCSSITSIQKRMGATRDFATGKINSQDLIKLPSGWIYGLNVSKYKNGQSALEIKKSAEKSASNRLRTTLPQSVYSAIIEDDKNKQVCTVNPVMKSGKGRDIG